MNDFQWDFLYSSHAVMPVFARNVVATSQPLAAQAGLQMLGRGGNAVDAAIATAVTLAVVEPTSNGIGSDAFAQVWDGELHGLNASGRAPEAWNPARFAGRSEMPLFGWDSVTVPGAVSSWVALSERFGALPFADLFEPAIRYARDGFAVSPLIAQAWGQAKSAYAAFPEWTRTFCPGGRAPDVGRVFRCPEQARTLELIAQTRGEAFYRGVLAHKMADDAKQSGGALTLADLESHRADWVAPIGIGYRGYTLHEIPPNGQGLAALIALGILERTPIGECALDGADWLHLGIEAMKLAFADVNRFLADPRNMEIGAERFLLPEYLDERAKLITLSQAGEPNYGVPPHGGTVYLCTADASGMMVSLIQSNYYGFGSGVVVPGTGISLQNRGYGFTLEPGHPNEVGSGKRPLHTILPGFVTKDGAPFLSFGVMGGPMQPQGHVQMLLRLIDGRQNPQAACDAPRWRVLRGRQVSLEAGFTPEVLAQLRERGHELVETEEWGFGGAQLICKQGDGFCAASDGRKDGQAVGF